MGSNWETATIDRIDSDPAVRSRLATDINTELQARFNAARAAAVGHPDGPRDRALAAGATAVGGQWKPVDLGFSDFFWDLGVYPEVTTNDRSRSHVWSYGRVLANSLSLQCNIFSRVDIVRHLNRSFTDYCNIGAALYPGYPAHPGGDIWVTIAVCLSTDPGAIALASTLRLSVVTKTNIHQCEIVQGDVHVGGNSFIVNDNLRYELDSLALPGQNGAPVARMAGRLNPTLMNDVGGLHGWTSIKIRKVGGAIVPNQICPVDGRITSTFRLAPLNGATPPADRRAFNFRTNLDFVVNPADNSEWIVSLDSLFFLDSPFLANTVY